MQHAIGSVRALGLLVLCASGSCFTADCSSSPREQTRVQPSSAQRVRQTAPGESAVVQSATGSAQREQRMAHGEPAAIADRSNAASVASSEPDGTAATAANDARLFAGTQFRQGELLAGLASGELSALRPVGSTSTVFRAQLNRNFRAAFKTSTHQRPSGHVAEMAAYRLARCLGLDNVPPAVLRRVPVAMLRRELNPEYASSWPSIVSQLWVSRDGLVEGVAIYWIEGLQDIDLASAEGRAAAARALRLSEPMPDASQSTAASLSTLQAFDYLIGNWDRWSGGNVKGDASGRILYMRDHDAAFPGKMSEALQRRLLEPVVASERFSRSFVQHLRALDRGAFERELARDPLYAAHPRLDERHLAALFDRRGALLSHVAVLIEEHGEARVLAFP